MTSPADQQPQQQSNPTQQPAQEPAPAPQQQQIQTVPADQIMQVEEARINQIIEKRKVILKLIAKHIRPTEIRLFGDEKRGFNIHFERAACEQILSWAGAKLTHVRKEMEIIEDEQGTYRDYEMWGTLEFMDGRSIEVMGNCSTRSDFYALRRNGEKEYYLPMAEVDIPSVKQAAMTNLWNHACVRSMGLKAITIDDLKAAGMKIEQIKKQEFGAGTKGGSTASPEEKTMQTQMSSWLIEMNGGDQNAAADHLMRMTTFTGRDNKQVPGKRSTLQLTGKWLAGTHEKVKAEYLKWRGTNGLPEIQIDQPQQQPTQAAPQK